MKTTFKSYWFLLMALPFWVTAQQTSYDSDGDGIPDSTDQCPLVKGLADYKGCPYAKRIRANDRDGDGVIDVDDQCPDIFGLVDNKGCPSMRKVAPAQEKSSLSPNNSMLTTVSSLSAEEAADFRQSLLAIAGDSSKASTVKGERDLSEPNKFKSPVCLTGANECYYKEDTKTYYADYGKYDDETAAADKYYSLKQRLAEALGEKDWTGTETSAGGYIDHYELTRHSKGPRSPVVAAHVNRMGDNYHVYITVEQK